MKKLIYLSLAVILATTFGQSNGLKNYKNPNAAASATQRPMSPLTREQQAKLDRQLIEAAGKENAIEEMKELIQQGARINTKLSDGVPFYQSYWWDYTPLTHAVSAGILENVNYLISQETIDINLIDGNKYAPIDWAVTLSNDDILETLLSRKDIQLNNYCEYIGTPLRFAIVSKQKNKVELLLKYGADINHKDKKGNTPLSTAVYNKDYDMVEFLLSQGADSNQTHTKVMSPEKGQKKIKAFTSGTIPPLTNGDGNVISTLSPLQGAILLGRADMVNVLLEHKAMVNQPCGYFATAIDYAKDREQICVNILKAGNKEYMDRLNVLHNIINLLQSKAEQEASE